MLISKRGWGGLERGSPRGHSGCADPGFQDLYPPLCMYSPPSCVYHPISVIINRIGENINSENYSVCVSSKAGECYAIILNQSAAWVR